MNNTMTFTTLRRKADLLVRTGVLLMECGADTSRIMRTMTRLSVHFGIPHENLHIDVRWSLVAVNISDATHSVYKSQKVRRHRIDMNTMAVVSKLSWRAISHNYDVEHYAAHLKDIERGIGGTYAPWLLCLCAAIACAGFAVFSAADGKPQPSRPWRLFRAILSDDGSILQASMSTSS